MVGVGGGRMVDGCLSPSRRWDDGDVGGRSHGRIHVASLRRRRGWFASSKSCLAKSGGGGVCGVVLCLCCYGRIEDSFKKPRFGEVASPLVPASLCALLVVVRVDRTTSGAAAGDDSVGDPGRAGVAMGGVGRALWWCWWL